MMIFKKAIPRRTFLRGVGTTLALPLLDGMVPAFAAKADAAVRLGVVYVSNGIIMDKWTPVKEGAGFELTPILEPLAPFQDRLLVLSGLEHIEGGGGPHARSSTEFLTGVVPNHSLHDLGAGISLDQIAAKELGKHTQLASLELSVDSSELVGESDDGYSAAYTNTISWRNPATPMPTENYPRAVFERLFGYSASADPAERLARIGMTRSILDSVTQDVARLLTGLGSSDRAKFAEYLDSIRDVERRIQFAEEQSSQELPVMEVPAGMPANYEEHAKLMFDLQALAYQCDLTRVTTFMMCREKSTRVYREIGIAEPHHPLSHHRDVASKIAQLVKINIYHARMFAYFLEKLRSTSDGDGSLLDHSMIMYGGGLSDGNKHLHGNLPILLVGGGAGQVKGGRHLRYLKGTPMANLLLTILDMTRVPVERLGNSSGKLELLSV